MYFLALESSCDETAAAVFTEEPRVLSSVVASQMEYHTPFGGVVPEIAARAHQQKLIPVIDEALRQAGIRLADVGAIAVQNSPGLVGALLISVSAAKMLAMTLHIPLIAVNHVAAHIYACRLAAGRDIFPCIGLVVSGGHTTLFLCHDALNLQMIGSTRDDAAGEAFDKVSAILGLGFPGGPRVEQEARTGNPKAFAFPRSMLEDPHFDFSFSGLKTAVLYTAHGQNVSTIRPLPADQRRADLAASFQQAVIDVLVLKCRRAMRQFRIPRLAVGGGVTANQAFRGALQAMCAKESAELLIPPMNLCTDNAAMAALAVEKWRIGDFAPPDLDAQPTLQ
ncbi:tRNA (adenosine(37)-N6)-threonylcarbamoyltransferase complex transferase subunit TsaD [Tuwongella immobilis]|uniref:tRNA N6-adenosine threonylcarbamoyltransferase n=1 Tax=Tuwongella immobilis TaxID=692036 RepID=A0A6C2YSK7_9BACT|nr:tRNA (adenosine(37)-N6)-threonylcarbamoyltransferase complex transferase subunit TsaD [Tuwongella immobilis]VIP03862.1 trna threonylcarbamoyladenosine modification protein : tRNA N6-adenosine threonylcarbamoyltransferase OS=Planctomyces brasiliensis (strain ATCC 49424 / DSM 5305 / JCM 21570 / NBRC 103401 / IFAM 1448) GN=tsaD PE=3 SV=1: Peptidase_M22 [Tuwongella immobilis]VTS05091.1 trna threonylcarbamoyladenosine modification protein : tRNA N6-adenosine threonylcarbamoyltransferase OS=Planctom